MKKNSLAGLTDYTFRSRKTVVVVVVFVLLLPLLNEQNEVVDSAEGMSQEFNRFFTSVFNREGSGNIPEATWVYKEKTNGLCDIEITEKLISEKPDRLRDAKAAGADDLVPRFLNGIKQEIVSPLAILFRKVLDEQEVPLDWKEANVIPIFKGGQRCAPSNYRPVSLTSQICKIFEAVVRDKVVGVHALFRHALYRQALFRHVLFRQALFRHALFRHLDQRRQKSLAN